MASRLSDDGGEAPSTPSTTLLLQNPDLREETDVDEAVFKFESGEPGWAWPALYWRRRLGVLMMCCCFVCGTMYCMIRDSPFLFYLFFSPSLLPFFSFSSLSHKKKCSPRFPHCQAALLQRGQHLQTMIQSCLRRCTCTAGRQKSTKGKTRKSREKKDERVCW